MEVLDTKIYDENSSNFINVGTPRSSRKNKRRKSLGLKNNDSNRNVQEQEDSNTVSIDSATKGDFPVILSKPAAQLDDPSPVKDVSSNVATKRASKPPIAKFTKDGMRESLITFAETPKSENNKETEPTMPAMTPGMNDKMSDLMTPAAINNSRKQYAGRTPKHNYSVDFDSDSDESSKVDVMSFEKDSSPTVCNMLPPATADTPVLDELKTIPLPHVVSETSLEAKATVMSMAPVVSAPVKRVESPSVAVPALSMQYSSRRTSQSPLMPTPPLTMDVQMVAPPCLPNVAPIETKSDTPMTLTAMEPVAKMPSPSLCMPTVFHAAIPRVAPDTISESTAGNELIGTDIFEEIPSVSVTDELAEEKSMEVAHVDMPPLAVEKEVLTSTESDAPMFVSEMDTSLMSKAAATIANTEEILRLTDPSGAVPAPASAETSESGLPTDTSIIVIEKDPTFQFNPLNTNSGVFAPSVKNTRKILNNANKPIESAASAHEKELGSGINTSFPALPSTQFQNKAIHNNSTKVNAKVEQTHTDVIPITTKALDINATGCGNTRSGPSRALNRNRAPCGSNISGSVHPIGISVNMSVMRPSATLTTGEVEDTASTPTTSSSEMCKRDEEDEEVEGPNVTAIIENHGVKPHVPKQNHHYQPHSINFGKDNKNFKMMSNIILPSNQTWGSQLHYQHRDALVAPDMNATSLGYYKTNDIMQNSGRRRHAFGSSSSVVSTDTATISVESGTSEASSEFVYDLTTANHFEIESDSSPVAIEAVAEAEVDLDTSVCSYTSSSTKSNHNDTTITLNDVYNDFESTPMMVVASAKEVFTTRQAINKASSKEEYVELDYEDENRGDMKELLLVGDEINKATTIKVTYGNKRSNGVLCIKSRAVQMRFDPYHTSSTSGYMSAITPIKCNNTPAVCAFEVSPYKLDVAPDTVGTSYITFTPKAYGVYSGALKLISNNKSFVILLRGECKNPTPLSNWPMGLIPIAQKEDERAEEEGMGSSVDLDDENSILECLQTSMMDRSGSKSANNGLPPRSPTATVMLSDTFSAMKACNNLSSQCDVSVSTCFSSDEPHESQINCSIGEKADYDSMGASNMDSSFNSLHDSKCIATPPHDVDRDNISHMTMSSVHSMNDDAKVVDAAMGLESLALNQSTTGVEAEPNKQHWIHQWIQEQKKQAVATISSVHRSNHKIISKSPVNMPASLRLAAANISSAKKSPKVSSLQLSHTKSIPSSCSNSVLETYRSCLTSAGSVSESLCASESHSMQMTESLVSKHERFDSVLPSTPIAKSVAPSNTAKSRCQTPGSCISAAQALLMIRQRYASKSAIDTCISGTMTPTSIRAKSTAAIPTSVHKSLVQSNACISTETTNTSMVSGYLADHYMSLNSSQTASHSMVSLSPSPYKIRRTYTDSVSESESVPESFVFFSNPVVDFGDNVTVGSLCRMKAELCNTSENQVQLTVLDPSLPFVVLHNNITIEPKSYVKIPIRFIPAVPGKSFDSQLTVTMENHPPIVLQLKGKSN